MLDVAYALSRTNLLFSCGPSGTAERGLWVNACLVVGQKLLPCAAGRFVRHKQETRGAVHLLQPTGRDDGRAGRPACGGACRFRRSLPIAACMVASSLTFCVSDVKMATCALCCRGWSTTVGDNQYVPSSTTTQLLTWCDACDGAKYGLLIGDIAGMLDCLRRRAASAQVL